MPRIDSHDRRVSCSTFRVSPQGSRGGFTLIELLVVIAIIALLIGLLLPAIQKVREAASRLRCQNNLKQLALGAHNYHDVNERFPGGIHQGGSRYTSLFVELLPYVEQEPLYKQWDFANPTTNGASGRASTVLKVYLCSSHPDTETLITFSTGQYALTTYGGNGGTSPFPPSLSPCNGVFSTTGAGSQPKYGQTGIALLNITDGASNTLLFSERILGDSNLDTYLDAPWDTDPTPPIQPSASYMVWAPPPGPNAAAGLLGTSTMINYRHGSSWAPPPPPPPPLVPPPPPDEKWGEIGPLWWARLSAMGSFHTGGANVAMGDGGVRFLRDSTPISTLQSLATRAGGEVLPGDW